MKKNIILGVSTFLLMALVAGYAFSKWTFSSEQNATNVFGSSCLDTSIQEGDAINLQNMTPLTDSDGMKLAPYTFTLTNNCDVPELVQVNLELFNNTLSSSQVNYSLNGLAPNKVVSLTTTTTLLDGATSAYVLSTDQINPGESKTYNLRLWVDEDETINSAANKTFDSQISITTSYGK